MIKTNNLTSRYIPVGKLSFPDKKLEWWNKDSYFHYPHVLVNLLLFKDNKTTYGFEKDNFLLTDSGGFQVITGTCSYDWKQSLQQQLKIGASKLFAFDKPPVKKKSETSNAVFIDMGYDEAIKIIENNLDVAIEQSKYLQTNHPDRVKDFYYIMHGSTKEMLDYNLELIKKKIGGPCEFKKCFGGVCYGSKADNNFQFTTVLLHAQHHFINRGFPVHFLGAGSPFRMILLVRNKITTFDSGTALTGITYWSWVNNTNLVDIFGGLSKTNWPFQTQFCDCPICSNVDYNQTIKERPEHVGMYIMVHNLYQLIKFNVFLNSIKTEEYTKTIKNFIKIPDNILNCLEYCDFADKEGFEIAYSKYKHFDKKDKSKQQTLL